MNDPEWRTRLSNRRAGFLNSWLRSVHLLDAEPCVLCGSRGTVLPLCERCDAGLPALERERCAICASPLPTGVTCGACLAHPPHYDRVTAAYRYEFPVDRLVHAYKYGGELRLARLLAHALSRSLGEHADVIVPMPLAPERLKGRGFNQAMELARELGRLRGIPVMAHACRRVTDRPPQALLPWRERARNIRGAFVCDADLRGLHVAVVDDVLTTGATMSELARNLKRAGALAVYGWVAARTASRLYRRPTLELE